ncbi:MAG: IS21 family transposase, partial [Acidimicrobiales bacterium]
EELVIVARTGRGLVEIARHELSVPGTPRIVDAHYPDHPAHNGPVVRPLRPRDEAEVGFLAL